MRQSECQEIFEDYGLPISGGFLFGQTGQNNKTDSDEKSCHNLASFQEFRRKTKNNPYNQKRGTRKHDKDLIVASPHGLILLNLISALILCNYQTRKSVGPNSNLHYIYCHLKLRCKTQHDTVEFVSRFGPRHTAGPCA